MEQVVFAKTKYFWLEIFLFIYIEKLGSSKSKNTWNAYFDTQMYSKKLEIEKLYSKLDLRKFFIK